MAEGIRRTNTTPLCRQKVGINFSDKRRSLDRYSYFAESGHTDWLIDCIPRQLKYLEVNFWFFNPKACNVVVTEY
jgi:hypothetical protein